MRYILKKSHTGKFDNKVKEIKIAYNNLMTIYKDAKVIDPLNLAIAISS